ncbi:hypothetical protein [Papillibacter cinnamivorans]|uniref:Uncharacterized protein n=1 Tax=Papillibacter cinnamivorans DSM 12816 TaxID=1122930 RepID=A0A1W1YYB7_9FIRM|nr:hypothetical protein [Papillibacter cinnamivorans]SMC41123.1 hypothetical protein SAMN02745168_0775 [Papillibacter cinnamivorans DSM 12816]
MASGSKYSEAMRDAVVADYAITGNGVMVAKKYDIPTRTVYNIIKSMKKKNPDKMARLDAAKQEQAETVLDYINREAPRQQKLIDRLLARAEDPKVIESMTGLQAITSYAVLVDKAAVAAGKGGSGVTVNLNFGVPPDKAQDFGR